MPVNDKDIKNKELIIAVLVISFLIGGLAGGLVGSVTSEYFTTWFRNEILGQDFAQDLFEKTLKVEEESATIEAVRKVEPSVVSIIVTKDLSKIYSYSFPFKDFFFDFPNFYFEFPQFEIPQGKKEVGGGTGFIVSQDGLILTNRHVVSDEEAEYTVMTNDGQKYAAQILARDPILDLAVVKIEAVDLPPAPLGESETLQIGQTVVAIGNALGEYRNTVTKGVVSGIGRTVTASDGSTGTSEVIEQAIQTDAAINPGNSGGPLINLAGQVIGVSTAMSQAGQLIGFAIPINEAKRIIDSVEKYGEIVRPFLGVRYLLINEDIARENNLTVSYGALIVRGEKITDFAVISGSPADKVGLKENDIILEVEGQKVDQAHSLARLLTNFQPGDEIKLKVLSQGEEKEVKVKLEKYED